MTLGEMIGRDMGEYCENLKKDVNAIAEDVQREMVTEIAKRTPVGIGGKKGHLKDGWTKVNIKLKGGGMLYGARSKNKPQLVHLVSFPHRVVSHGRDTGFKTRGDPFVSNVQDEKQAELDRRLNEYFGD